MQRRILYITVNESLVIFNRIFGVISRRGCSIDSFSMKKTEDSKTSIIIISLNGDDYLLDQLIKQLNKLQEVIFVHEIKSENYENPEYMHKLIALKSTSG